MQKLFVIVLIISLFLSCNGKEEKLKNNIEDQGSVLKGFSFEDNVDQENTPMESEIGLEFQEKHHGDGSVLDRLVDFSIDLMFLEGIPLEIDYYKNNPSFDAEEISKGVLEYAVRQGSDEVCAFFNDEYLITYWRDAKTKEYIIMQVMINKKIDSLSLSHFIGKTKEDVTDSLGVPSDDDINGFVYISSNWVYFISFIPENNIIKKIVFGQGL